MRPENGRVPGQVVEVVHDDGHEEVEHDERAQEDEGDEVDVRQGRAAVLARVQQIPWRQENKYFFTPIPCTYTSLQLDGMARNYFSSRWIRKST